MKSQLLLLAFLVGCECEQFATGPVEHCVESHSESTVEYGVGGMPLGGQSWGQPGIQTGSQTVCDRYETRIEEFCIDRKWPWE